MVAAAGFMLKQENIAATDNMATAFMAMKTWENAYSFSPSPAGKRQKVWYTWSEKTNMPDHGKSRRANPRAMAPRASTRTAEKTVPATHFTNSSRTREMGRDKIMRSVPSS